MLSRRSSKIRCPSTRRTHLFLHPNPSKRKKVHLTQCSTTYLPDSLSPDFYNTFWSLQLPFSKPPLFASSLSTFTEFKEAVSKVLPVIREATTKERAMLGTSRSSLGSAASSSSLKRKREPEAETAGKEYFFAKFLTSPDLLELEVRAYFKMIYSISFSCHPTDR